MLPAARGGSGRWRPRGGPTSRQAEGGRAVKLPAPAAQGTAGPPRHLAPPARGVPGSRPAPPPALQGKPGREGSAGPPGALGTIPRPWRGETAKLLNRTKRESRGAARPPGFEDESRRKYWCSGWAAPADSALGTTCGALGGGGPRWAARVLAEGSPPVPDLQPRHLSHTGRPPRDREPCDGKRGLGGLKWGDGI